MAATGGSLSMGIGGNQEPFATLIGAGSPEVNKRDANAIFDTVSRIDNPFYGL